MLVIERGKRLLQLVNLRRYAVALAFDKLQPSINRAVAIGTQIHKQLDILDGHTGLLEALYHGKAFHVGIIKHAYAPVGTLDKRQQAFLVVVTKRACGNAHSLCHFTNRVKHILLLRRKKLPRRLTARRNAYCTLPFVSA